MKGFGTVVTGTLWAGRLRAGDDVVALPARSGAPRQGARRAGARRSRRRGARRAAHRGQPDACRASSSSAAQVLVRAGRARGRAGSSTCALRYLATSQGAAQAARARCCSTPAPRRRWRRCAARRDGAASRAAAALAQLQLDEPMVLLPGDRFILRGFALQRHHGTTLGGGVVLRTLGARHAARHARGCWRRCAPSAEQAAPATSSARAARGGARGRRRASSRAALQMRLPHAPRAVDAALARLLGGARGRALRQGARRGVGARRWRARASGALAAVEAFHAAQPLAAGMPREELRAKVPERRASSCTWCSRRLGGDGTLVVDRDTVRRRAHDPAQRSGARGAGAAGRARWSRSTPARRCSRRVPSRPRPRSAVDPRGAGAGARHAGARRHAGAHEGSRVPRDRASTSCAPSWWRTCRRTAQITPQEWKELVGASRKFTIPLAEHFDAEKLTMRVGEVRKLRGLPKR